VLLEMAQSWLKLAEEATAGAETAIESAVPDPAQPD
jgi:hypothetical protein